MIERESSMGRHGDIQVERRARGTPSRVDESSEKRATPVSRGLVRVDDRSGKRDICGCDVAKRDSEAAATATERDAGGNMRSRTKG